MSGRKNIDAAKIAQLAGVSRATVSRVVNSYAFVKPATRKRVLEVIERYAYSPNFSAQILAGKRSKTIGLFHFVVKRIEPHSRLEDTHINFMTEQIINTATLGGCYTLVHQICDVNGASEQKKIRDMFNQNRIDAGIFMGFPNSCELIEELVAHGFVIGVFNQYRPDKTEPNRVVVRLDYSSIAASVDYAVSLGHERIMFIGTDMANLAGLDVFPIFSEAMAKHGLPIRPDSMLCAQALARIPATETFSAFMETRTPDQPLPTCIICGNDIMAFGVIDALRRYGLDSPRDVAIIGSDDILVSQYFTPPLTTMRYNFDGMMKTLTLKVLECVEKPLTTQFIGTYSGEIIIRESCRDSLKRE
ncbi:MAG: LacI family transcriptional regulator [Treponema sp.]|nr:LacI family transcriptional regulator [Treponema sp.]